MNNVLECTHLAKSYKEGNTQIDVLSNINLSVKSEELIAIVGSSGSGKSTLLHLLGGLDKPTLGVVKLKDHNFQEISEVKKCYLRNHYLGFIYQFHHLLPEFTALENVSMPLLIRGETLKTAQPQAESMLEAVGLKQRLSHKVGELSGGERQRVAIARAIVTNPACVLADEPTGNLDPKNAEKVLELFFDLQKKYKTSVVMVTHDMKIAQHAQRILTLENGCLTDLLVNGITK